MMLDYRKVVSWEINGEEAELLDSEGNVVDVLDLDDLIQQWLEQQLEKIKGGGVV